MDEQPFEVHLIKGPQGLGMSLTGGEMGGNGPIYIKRLVPGGSAALSGQLQVNDILLQVNGKSMERLSYREALSILRNCPPEVRLLVKRSKGSSYPPYPGFRGSVSSYASYGSYGSMSSLS
ncbi:disks large homolog 1-like [Exaiptasia diaphana]|uniref:PDZ domain-containing protein n=1 Tax=Exaiptasia diaphana TaxID=2652724 RepID=A0A913X4X1_EXADI|nr:disks large homolog 1-like [Exaiptasia diaphana]